MLLYLIFVSMNFLDRIEQRIERDSGVLRNIKINGKKKKAHKILCGGNWGAQYRQLIPTMILAYGRGYAAISSKKDDQVSP